MPPLKRAITELIAERILPIAATADWVATPTGSVWVGGTGPNSVSHIDPATNTVTDVVALPGEPCAGLVLAGGYLWVPLCAEMPRLARVDIQARKLDKVFPVGPAAYEGGGAGSEKRVWLVNGDASALIHVNAATGAVVTSTPIPAGAINLLHVNGVIFATVGTNNSLVAIDAVRGDMLASTPTGSHPHFLAFGAGCVWTLNQGDGSLSGIDAATYHRRFHVALHTPGGGGDIAFGGGKIWTTVRGTPLSMIDPQTGTVQAQWIGNGGDSLGITDNAIWLTNYGQGTITKYALSAVLAAVGE